MDRFLRGQREPEPWYRDSSLFYNPNPFSNPVFSLLYLHLFFRFEKYEYPGIFPSLSFLGDLTVKSSQHIILFTP